MIVIGVDPGTIVSGYGIVEVRDSSFYCISSGFISQPRSRSLPNRLRHIYGKLAGLIEQYSPDEMSIEDVFFSKNARSTLKLGEARGVSILAAAAADIPVYEYSPTEVKSAVTGNGRATKTDVQKMISAMLNIPEFEKSDTSDALAIAICHLNSIEIKKKYGFSIRKKSRAKKRFNLNDIPS
ncbi:MAG: crossover junction endodeoxyribonuclease RuvC [Candidatus Dadabacteria bacterium]|nr:crossover junction endodeoxyribonuclease RuvC [Candidatus Dadabacteria bacterium]NIS07445.1 crossover junction endodeoxyribonuclease RuvC [Candidatus Dadabacteria bacterium]NIY21097.1 crossover junction endodeoxyribonuclease RuvC [Candidatus Dadabacteria bacterium]